MLTDLLPNGRVDPCGSDCGSLAVPCRVAVAYLCIPAFAFISTAYGELAAWHGSCNSVAMSHADLRLLRHLLIAVALKLAVLSVLWLVFVKENRVETDAETVAAQVVRPPPPQGTQK